MAITSGLDQETLNGIACPMALKCLRDPRRGWRMQLRRRRMSGSRLFSLLPPQPGLVQVVEQ